MLLFTRRGVTLLTDAVLPGLCERVGGWRAGGRAVVGRPAACSQTLWPWGSTRLLLPRPARVRACVCEAGGRGGRLPNNGPCVKGRAGRSCQRAAWAVAWGWGVCGSGHSPRSVWPGPRRARHPPPLPLRPEPRTAPALLCMPASGRTPREPSPPAPHLRPLGRPCLQMPWRVSRVLRALDLGVTLLFYVHIGISDTLMGSVAPAVLKLLCCLGGASRCGGGWAGLVWSGLRAPFPASPPPPRGCRFVPGARRSLAADGNTDAAAAAARVCVCSYAQQPAASLARCISAVHGHGGGACPCRVINLARNNNT